ncbi:SIR2 family NAD-dependent protein deacylase [Hydrogenimonas urashimensis]|uniref:SIR2 family NAD-dependent protein deacylase n=1 Tax=Hydrogenimonas urashimensis TaxID=2740515 RepID=UPI0019154E0C|nr:NAD-dependent deacylase [Hydrogenimonas urashimensis]
MKGTTTNDYEKAAGIIQSSKSAVAFTGAGISVESGIPTFRGPSGLWSRYDPKILDIDYFMRHPESSWRTIREIFYDFMQNIELNAAHRFLAKLETRHLLRGVITQNIDSLHQKAGSRNVIEFHGTAGRLTCLGCGKHYDISELSLKKLPPKCEACGGLLKPDFVFFKEPIPKEAFEESSRLCLEADLLLIIGTTGEIMPASQLPYSVPETCRIIEINIEPSNYTHALTDIFLQEKATVAAEKLDNLIFGREVEK